MQERERLSHLGSSAGMVGQARKAGRGAIAHKYVNDLLLIFEAGRRPCV